MGGPADELTGIAAQLALIAEQLSDLAIDRLRAAIDPDDPEAAGAAHLERRITRARRAVEKAASLLDETSRSSDE
jgi:hypothetical protein